MIEFLIQIFFEGLPDMIQAAFDDEQPIVIRCLAAIGGFFGVTVVVGGFAAIILAAN